MEDDHVSADASAGEGGEVSPAEPVHGAAPEGDADSVGQDLAMQMDPMAPTDGNAVDSFHHQRNETRAPEDGGREDTFVDCPDEIETSESQPKSEEKDNPLDDQYNESDSGVKVEQLMAEIELLRDMHEKSVDEKERFAREYEEERVVLMRELALLCCQLKVPNEKQTTSGENADELVNHLQTEAEILDETSGSGASLHEMISECSRFLKNASDERLQADEKVRELHSVLCEKDREIDFLNAKFAELSESTKIAQSNSSSEHENLSQLYEIQLEKDKHIEELMNRISALLSTMHHQEELSDGSLTEKISNIEKSVAVLVEKYNLFVSESEQLRGCLNEVGLDFNMTDEIGTLVTARDKILELRRKEENLNQNLSNLEDENRKLVEELEKQRSIVENVNAEIGRLSVEVEQEKNRYANTKEKLSMAVTKGKALVQQRDSLKQLLAEKTSQLEKCSIELQEKSSALEAAEKTKDLVAESENFAASLQESLAEKDIILQRCGEILSESVGTEELQPTDITEKVRWLADENKSMKAISLQYHKLTDALMLFDFPETVASNELDVRVRWLAESFYLSKEEATKLQSEIAQTKEAANGEIDHLTASLLAVMQEKSYLQAELEDIRNKYEARERSQHDLSEAREALNNEIEHLTASLLAESQEKSYLQVELENLRHKYEGVVQNEYLVSSQKDKLVSMLLEVSGLTNDGQEEYNPDHSDMTTFIDKCLAKIKENSCRYEASQVDAEIFGSFQSLLYIRDQEMSLYKLIVEEDILDRVQVSRLSNELEAKTQELNAIKDEKAVMQESLKQLEDRCALLKEKLSMAVKKGKGLVQERENLKGALNEKNSEIDRLKSELRQNSSRYAECQDQITKLSLDVERISLLETDLIAAKAHGEQLEQFLAESNSMLQGVMESIESITPPTDMFFKEPAGKVRWIAGYLSELEISKMELEQELRKVKDEASFLASKLSDVEMMMKSLEDALSNAENSRSQLLDEKKELEVSKALLEEEVQKEKEKASSCTRKFEELSLSKISLENALSLAEDNISRYMSERDIAVESRALAEEQLQKLKDDFSDHISKLADANKTIQSLEDALSQAQKNISLLTEENSKVQIGCADLDSEIKKIREEADSHACKVSDASLTIKSLEDALLNAENNMAELVQEKKKSEEEILVLTSKLESCMEELGGTRGSIENQSLELSAQLSRLQFLLKDDTFSSLLGQCSERKFESLKNMDFLLKEIGDCFLEMDCHVLQNNSIMEDESSISTTLPASLALNVEMLNDEVNAVDRESIVVQIEKMRERFHLKGKILADKFENISRLMDESIAALLRRLHMTKDRTISIMKYTKSLKQQMKDMEIDKQRQDDTIVSLESDIRILSSACTDAIERLESGVRKNVSELRSIHELIELDGRMSMDLGAVGDDATAPHATDPVKTAEKLLLAARQNQDLSKLFQDAINKLASITGDMQNKMKETQVTCDQVLEERELYKEKILKLETDLKAQKTLCHGMTIELDEYKEKEDNLRKREAELSTSLSKINELENSLLSASQVKSILDKMNEVDLPDAVFAAGDSHDSAIVRKLFYVIDSFNGSLQKVSSLSRENEELQSTIDELILEIELLKKQVEDHMGNEKDSEMTNKLLELESGLQNIVRKLGGSDLMDDKKVDGAIWLLPLLDKLVMARMLESESLKSKNEELGAKLLGTQKVVDDLSNKVKLQEDSNQTRILPTEIDQETRTSTASMSTQSEISEMQDMAAVGKIKPNIPHAPTAAHVRTLRKNSSDHLAISIDTEPERLINNEEADEDKGHIFKSLNTTGLIPRQGRTVADRVDGIWVSGSRALMNHPRGRLGIIAYWLVLHIWLLGTIL